MPESAPLELTTPPGFPTAEAFREQLRAALAQKEAEAARKFASFLGAARVNHPLRPTRLTASAS